MLKQPWLMLLAAAVLLGAAPARATIGPPVHFRLLGEPRAAAAGEEFRGELEIVVDVTAELAGFRLEGAGWTPVFVEAPASVQLEKSGRLVVPFAAVPADPEQFLEFVFELGGHTVRKSLDLSERNFRHATEPQAAKEAPPPEGLPPHPDELQLTPSQLQTLPKAEPQGQPDAPADAPGDGKYSITVYGYWSYQRTDGPWIGAYGCLVRVWDEDYGDPNDLLASTYVLSNGYYSVTFDWSQAEGGPEIYVEFETLGYRVDTRNATSHNTYLWRTGTTPNYGGTSLNMGSLTSGDEGMMPALHVHTNAVRTWRWLNLNEGYDTPDVDVYWPDGTSGAWYWADIIHISSGSQWSEATVTHEYGHHWMDTFGDIPPFNYCNGICDPNYPTDCGHCLWCWESGAIAWLEGFPDWMGDFIPDTYAATYGQAAWHAYNFEGLSTCSGSYHDPYLTEGFMAALLLDISDSNNDSHGVYGSWADVMNVGTNEIFDVADFDLPQSAQEFIVDFKNRWPSLKEPFWETAKNCGYDEDTANPATVTNLTSPTHPVGSELPNPNVLLTWTRATDDFSGVQGYGIWIASGHGLPSAVLDIGDVTSYTTPALAPGTYYFSIRTVDRAGRWSGGYAWYGPFSIRVAEPANLAFYLGTGWDHVLVPRASNDATFTSVHVPATLPGNASSSYWNVRGINNGESSTSVGFQTRLFIDDAYTWWWSWGSIGAGGGFYGLNGGPFTVRGGRHTFGARLDATDQIPETNENDNVWAHQWIWTPLDLAANTPVTRNSPPIRDAGWSWVVDGSTLWYNSDGLRFSSTGWWNAVVLRHTNLASDYDLRLHAASTGATDGFAANIGYSTRLAGLTDAVIVNRNTQGINSYDVGVLNWNAGSGTCEAEHVTNGFHAFGDSLTYTFAANKMLRLWEFYVYPEDVGPISITVDPAAGTQTFYALWLDRTFTSGDLFDYSAIATAPAGGRGRIDVTIAEAGYNCLVVYRDPADGTAAADVTIEIDKTPPDFLNYHAAGWHSPLVPRPAHDGTPASVALPDTLHGNQTGTRMNMAVRNESPSGAPFLHARGFLDGSDLWWVSWGAFPGYANSLFNWDYAFNIRGGRHTLAFRLDWDQELEEIHEDNNIYGEQYMWSPLLLTMNTPLSRGAPPERSGGWEDIRSGEGIWYNCDGLRLPNAGDYWRAVAVMPGAASDVDVRLHPLLAGAKNGFGSSLAYSGWGTGQSDYVLVNFNVTSFQAYDAGVMRWSGTQSYTVEATSASGWTSYPSGRYGPYSVAGGRILNLHEYYLPAGQISFRLDNTAGNVDFGMTLHPAGQPYLSKSTAVSGGVSWLRGPGLGEWFTADVPSAGWYCLVVWKAFTSDLPLAGTYYLNIGAGLTDVPDGSPPPAATRIAGIHPNPFNPQTAIAYDLAAAQAVKLEVYDLQGTRVRTLVAADMPAGRHEAVWDGRDETGRQLASGVYMARLAAGEIREMRKMVLLK